MHLGYIGAVWALGTYGTNVITVMLLRRGCLPRSWCRHRGLDINLACQVTHSLLETTVVAVSYVSHLESA